mgnify:CR=1 FL=1
MALNWIEHKNYANKDWSCQARSWVYTVRGGPLQLPPFSPFPPLPLFPPFKRGVRGSSPGKNFEILLCRRWVLAHFGFEFVDQSSTGFLSILRRLNFFVLLNWRHLDWPIFMEYSQVYGTNINNNSLISQETHRKAQHSVNAAVKIKVDLLCKFFKI